MVGGFGVKKLELPLKSCVYTQLHANVSLC